LCKLNFMTFDAAGEPDWADLAEQRVLDAALELAPATGWSPRTLARAAAEAGLSPGEALLLLPAGPKDLAALLSRRCDQAALAALAEVDPRALKMRERIRRGAEAWLDAAEACGDAAVRRWAGFLALPPNLPLGLRLAWESADGLWRWAGDTAADENHYSKRAILAGVLISSLAIHLNEGRPPASAYVNARIENILAFEAWKQARKPFTAGRDLAQALGRLRHRPKTAA